MRLRLRALAAVALLGTVALLSAPAPTVAAAQPETFTEFAPVPEPGQPEGLAVAPDGTVYAGTDVAPFGVRPEGIQLSRVFAFSAAGKLLRSYVIAGERYAPWYGLFGLAVDGDGIVYALDHNPPRVVALDPVTGAQLTYSSFPQLPPCSLARLGSACKDTAGDMGAFPNFIVFASDGTMYVTDTSQAVIWRIPRGGGPPQVLYTNRDLESLFGPNDLALAPDGRTLLLGLSTPSYDGKLNPGVYALAIRRDGTAGALRQVWLARSGDSPEGGQFAQSGRIYVTASGANQVVILSPDGQELRRAPRTSSDNAKLQMPLNEPATIAFDGSDALVTNHAWTGYSPSSWSIIDYHAGEPGLALNHPIVRPFVGASGSAAAPVSAQPAATRIRLRVSPSHAAVGRLTAFRFSATAAVGGRPRALPAAAVSFAGHLGRTNQAGRTVVRVRLRRRGVYRARAREMGLLDGFVAVRALSRRKRGSSIGSCGR